MKLICSTVHIHKMDAVKRALGAMHLHNLRTAEVQDHAPQRYETTVWRGHEYSLGFSKKVSIDLAVEDEQVDEVVRAIIDAARTGERGDGHILVLPIEHRYSIRGGD